MTRARFTVLALLLSLSTSPAAAQENARLTAQKADAVRGVDEMAKMAQVMVDSVFSFGELGFQEVETSKYLTGQLEKFGFKVHRSPRTPTAPKPSTGLRRWYHGRTGGRPCGSTAAPPRTTTP